MLPQPHTISRRRMVTRWYGLLAALLMVSVAVAPTVARAASPLTRTAATAPATYTNPVITTTTPDPADIKALDGYYYLAATSDYWPGGVYHILPIFRSTDLVHWSYVTDTFTPATKPAWTGNGLLFAPDLQYYNHKYYMYYNTTATTSLYGGGSAIGVATADTMTGPWTDKGSPVVPPRQNSDGRYFDTIDPAEFTDQDGQKYLYWGSYFGGTLVQKLLPNGLKLDPKSTPVQIGHWDRYEGTYVERHDVNGHAYYYNFSSTANCCAGPATAYSVVVSRATSPMGPFVDQNSYPMLRPGTAPNDNQGAEGGGYPTLKQTGNSWHGVGHNALITDLSGHQWIVYHGVNNAQGYVPGLDPSLLITYRQLLIDRLDWTPDGWPVVNGGAGPSDGPMAAPVTTPLFGANFNAGACGAPPFATSTTFVAVQGTFGIQPGTCTTGGYATAQGLAVSAASAPAGYRAECDLRLHARSTGRYGCVVSYQQGSSATGGDRFLVVFVDPAQNALVTTLYNNGQPSGEQVSPLPAGFAYTDWHHLTVDQEAGSTGQPTYRITLSDRNRDPLAVQERALPAVFGQGGGAVGVMTTGRTQADFDNITVAALDTAPVPAPPTPSVGTLLPAYSDEFNGSLGPQWSWVREDPSKHSFVNDQLEITVNGDLYRQFNSATNILLENQPTGDYVMETKLTFDPNQNFQSAGLLVYSDDDHYIKVGPYHHFSLNKILSARETLEPQPSSNTSGQPPCDETAPQAGSNVAVAAYSHDQCPAYGEAWDYLANPNQTENGSAAYQPRVTDWLRIYRHGDVYTPYVSLDDVQWVKGSAWTLPAAAPGFPVRIGLYAFSAGSHNDVPALFDYVHVYTVAGSGGGGGGGGTATPELGSGELLATGLLPLCGALLYRRYRRRHADDPEGASVA